jgi:hypothetical protein
MTMTDTDGMLQPGPESQLDLEKLTIECRESVDETEGMIAPPPETRKA